MSSISSGGGKGRMVSKSVKKLREDKGLTQQQLAYLLGCDVRTISRWETGESGINYPNLLKLSKIFAVSIEEISDGTI